MTEKISFEFIFFLLLFFWGTAILLDIIFLSSISIRRFFVFRPMTSFVFKLTGIIVLSFYIFDLWNNLDRPPLRTLGETRLWYALFLPLIGVTMDLKLKIRWMSIFSILMALLFLFIDFLHPNSFDKTLAPALRSPWFIPHVIVYIIAYALLGASCLMAFFGLFQYKLRRQNKNNPDPLIWIHKAHPLVYTGFSFLTLGLIFGALWAKQAWGHYWTWDPKETWAFLTWAVYLLYIHWKHSYPLKTLIAAWLLAFGFLILLGCWFGVNYLPSSRSSVHTYSE